MRDGGDDESGDDDMPFTMSDTFYSHLGESPAPPKARAAPMTPVPAPAPVSPAAPAIDVQTIRFRSGLTQADFANSIGVPVATFLKWERQQTNPTGAARVLLRLIAVDPLIVQRMLGKP